MLSALEPLRLLDGVQLGLFAAPRDRAVLVAHLHHTSKLAFSDLVDLDKIAIEAAWLLIARCKGKTSPQRRSQRGRVAMRQTRRVGMCLWPGE